MLDKRLKLAAEFLAGFATRTGLSSDILPDAAKCATEPLMANRCSDVTLTRFGPALCYSLVVIGDAVQVGPLHRGPSLVQQIG